MLAIISSLEILRARGERKTFKGVLILDCWGIASAHVGVNDESWATRDGLIIEFRCGCQAGV